VPSAGIPGPSSTRRAGAPIAVVTWGQQSATSLPARGMDERGLIRTRPTRARAPRSPHRRRRPGDLERELVPRPRGPGAETRCEQLHDHRGRSMLSTRPRTLPESRARRMVEEIRGELFRNRGDLLTVSVRNSPSSRRRALRSEQLEEARARKSGRAELVRRVGMNSTYAARSARRAEPHTFEERAS